MKRICLRELNDKDAETLYAICNDIEVRRSGFPCYEGAEDALRAIGVWRSITDNSMFSRAIAETATGSMVGLISIGDMNRYQGYYEIEYAIAAKSRNQGYATQALREMLSFAFEKCQADVISAWVRSHNNASVHVLEKCGFVFEGRLRRHARDKSDTLCYSITQDEWKALSKDV